MTGQRLHMTNEDDSGGDLNVEYDPERETYRAHHDFTNGTELSVTIAAAVGEVLGRDPADLEVNEVVHPDALNSLFGPRYDGTPRQGGTLTFRLASCSVTIHADGEVVIDPEVES
jgi:hypothetical protein